MMCEKQMPNKITVWIIGRAALEGRDIDIVLFSIVVIGMHQFGAYNNLCKSDFRSIIGRIKAPLCYYDPFRPLFPEPVQFKAL